ncbi:hypothetical protein MKW98_020825 [Papaver atlanticum]|uniref:CASP-like protein n=1 Tax=Papaver atlanticum TaxID=357466 RepID=A0AAD4TFH4_9MAGN|nr:hypothetical protein MKW98_020825 [Papaver atlanticum]
MENSGETATRDPVNEPEYVQEKAKDVESGGEAIPTSTVVRTDMESGGASIPTTTIRSGKSGLSEKGSLTLRVAALVFSTISFTIMACVKGFDDFDQSRYVFAAGIISTVYNVFQVSRQSYSLSTGKSLFAEHTTSFMTLVDFFGDQIIAYLLISCASTVAPSVATLREVEDDLLADHGTSNLVAASTSMAFLAFFPMAVSAVISAYKLSPKT